MECRLVVKARSLRSLYGLDNASIHALANRPKDKIGQEGLPPARRVLEWACTVSF